MLPRLVLRIVPRLVLRTGLLWAVWVVLMEGRPTDSLVGLPVALVVAGWSLPRRRSAGDRARLRIGPLLALVPRVAWLSLAGGWDVAQRAFRRRPDLTPGFVDYPLHPPDARVAMGLAYLLTVMPGTLAARVEASGLRVHVLDRGLFLDGQLRPLEDRLRAGLGAARRGEAP